MNHPTSSDKSCHLIPPVLRLKSVVHFDPLISGVALCAQKAGQGVCRQRSPATGFKKPATSSRPSLILFLFFSLISLLLSLSEKKKALWIKGFQGVSPATGSATGQQPGRQHGLPFRMEAPSGGLLPRSAHESRPAKLSLLPMARCRKRLAPNPAVCRTWQRCGDWKTLSSPRCCCSLSR